MFWHTKNVCLNVLLPNVISHFTLPITPRLVPSAPTTLGNPVESRFSSLSFLYMSPDITLLEAPVSKSVLICVFLIVDGNTVPSAEPSVLVL